MSTAAPQRPRSDLADDLADGEESELAPRLPRPRRLFSQQFAYWMRWLHIYLSMLSFAALLFFAVTGLTVNHPDWFGASSVRTATAKGTLPAGLVPTTGADDAGIQKLELVEFLRTKHAIRGAVTELRADDAECAVLFKGPGYTADVTIDRAASTYDLHKGRDSGGAWSLLIDISAIVMAVVSISGLVLLFYLKRRLLPGLITAAVGTVVVYLIYAAFVP